MNNKVKISIITVVFNGEKYIEETILSVITQNYQNLEFIIIDGNSSDGTIAIINKYKEHITHIISEPDKGIYDAMNKGLNLASGEIIGFINADDYYANGAFELINNKIKKLKKDQQAVFYGKMISIRQMKSMVEIVPSLYKIPLRMSISHPSIFITAPLYKKEKFDTSYSIASDYNLILKLWYSGVKFIQINKVLSYMRAGGASDQYNEISKEESQIISNRNITVRHNIYSPIRAYRRKIYA
ncbi:glycosyltransferase family 2 protein, partial [Providencia sp. Me1]|uniref:glycosyltransferase family 2 protein n=1 Tax=Providencia sp. Me1 TaxID=3392634 RepID=UPI003D2BCE76